jgi:hypothetical protein
MKQSRNSGILENVIEWPGVYWVLIGFLCAYFIFFIEPILLNPDHTMKFFQYVPINGTVGQDLNYMLSYCASWLIDHNTPYIGHNLYPPLAMVIFSPLLLLEASAAYTVITAIIIAGYIFITFMIPVLVNSKKGEFATPLFFLITGLFSYGFHFELEKGQFNVIALSFCMLAIYLFHYKPRLRVLAYVLFTISVQLKVYPAIFILMFIDDWTKWKQILMQFAGMTLLNVALFFVLGYRVFLDFLLAIKTQALYPYIVMNNLSIKAFTELLFRKNGFRAYFLDRGMSLDQLHSLSQYAWILQMMLLLLLSLCLFIIIFKAVKQKKAGLNPHLLLACTLGALLIPSVSHDYKLSLLAGPMTILLQEGNIAGKTLRTNLIARFLMLIGSFAYSVTLFSYTNRPYILRNNFPMLAIVLIVFTIMAMLPVSKIDSEPARSLGV